MKRSLAPTPHQAELLQRIAADPTTPIDGGQSNTVWALEQRKLVKRSWSGHDGSQTVALTDQGRYFLKHGRHPEEVEQEARRNARDPKTAKEAPTDGAELIHRLTEAGGTLTIEDPGVMTRGRWTKAFYHALHHDHVPAGHKLRLTGREKGDLRVRLVDIIQEAPPAPLPVITVPDELKRPHPLISATRKSLGRTRAGMADTRGQHGVIPMWVSRPLVDRALRIMQGLLAEAEQRDYTVEARIKPAPRARDEPVAEVVITIKGHSFPLEICERTSQQPHEPTPRELRDAGRQPAWMRKPIPKYDHVPDGRLMIKEPDHHFHYGRRQYQCSDGSRWTLEARLGHLLAAIEQRADEAEAQRIKAEQAEQRRRQHWLDAVHQAHRTLIQEHRLKALERQLQAWRTASDIRSLCSAVREKANGTVTDETAEWIRWAETHAGFVGEFQERPLPSGRNARFHGRVMSLSFENTSVLASGPWLCSARRGGPGAAEVQGRSVRGDPS